MNIYHTSPVEIKEISKNGLFNDCLFFSNDVYTMTAGDFITYEMDVNEDSFIDVGQLDSVDYIKNIVGALEVSFDEAESYLCGFSTCEDPEDDFYIQAMQGAAAKDEGYLGAISADEQGTVYIIPMLGKESMLKAVS